MNAQRREADLKTMENIDKYTEAYKHVITEWLGPSPLFDMAKNGRVEDIEIDHVFGLTDEDRKNLEDFKVTAISNDSVEFTRIFRDGAKMVLRRDYLVDNSCSWSGKWYFTEFGGDGDFVEAEGADSAKAVQEKLWQAQEDFEEEEEEEEEEREEGKDYYDADHAAEWMEKNPHGWYNSEHDKGTGDEEEDEDPEIAEESVEDSTGTVSITLETMDDAYDADLYARNLEKMGFTCDYDSEPASHPSYTISAPADREAELKSFIFLRWTVGDPRNIEDCLEGVESSFLTYVKNGKSLDFKEAFADEIAESGYELFDEDEEDEEEDEE